LGVKWLTPNCCNIAKIKLNKYALHFMKKNIYVAIYAAAVLSFFSLVSCKKDSGSNTNPVNNQSTLKLKNVHIDDGGQYITDESFSYNADNKVSERKDSSSELQASVLTSYETWNSFFSYNSGDEKPVKDSTVYKRFIVSSGTTTSNTTTSYYYYDTQNRLIKTESFVAGTLVYTKLYTYVNGQRIEIYDLGAVYHIIDTLSINAQNQLTEWHINVASGGSNYTNKELFTYDSNKNPYNDLNITKYGTRGTDTAYASFNNISDYVTGPNNVIVDSSFARTGSTFGTYSLRTVQSGTYTYNDDHYPVSCVKQKNEFYNGTAVGSSTMNVSYQYY
jgi:hypothetical protein